MSIIQEALKKVQNTPGAASQKKIEAPEKQTAGVFSHAKPPLARKVSSFKISKNLKIPAIIAAALAVISAGILMARPMLAKKGMPGRDNAGQDITYKPLANFTGRGGVIESKQPELVLNGIMNLDEGSKAIINNSIVREGDVVRGAKIIKIREKSVTLISENTEITLHIK